MIPFAAIRMGSILRRADARLREKAASLVLMGKHS